MGAKGSHTLPKRLSRRRDFLYVQQQGRRLRGKLVTLLWAALRPIDAKESRLGYTVSRKVGGAVVRNRVRRRLREAVRTTEAPLMPDTLHVLIAHPQAAQQAYESLRKEVAWLLAKARSVPVRPASPG